MKALSSLLCKGLGLSVSDSLCLELCHCLTFLTGVSGWKGKAGDRVKSVLSVEQGHSHACTAALELNAQL